MRIQRSRGGKSVILILVVVVLLSSNSSHLIALLQTNIQPRSYELL